MRAHGNLKFSTPSPCRRMPPQHPGSRALLLGVECSFIVSPRAHVYMHDPPWLSRQDVLDRMLLLSDPGIQLLIFFNFHIFSLTHSKCVETLAVLCLPTIGGKKNLYEPTHRSSPPGLLPFVPNAAVSLRSLISGVLLDWLPITKFSLHYSFIWSAHSRVTTWSVQWWRGSIIRHTNNR